MAPSVSGHSQTADQQEKQQKNMNATTSVFGEQVYNEVDDIATVHVNGLPVDVKGYAHEHLTASFPERDEPPLEWMPVEEKGLRAHKGCKRLLEAASKVEHHLPKIGTTVHGVKLNQLTEDQKDDLALFVAQRGVVVFPDQGDLTPQDQVALGRYYGPLHRHSTTGVPKCGGLDEMHVVYSDETRPPKTAAFTTTDLFHSDVTYELQPPGMTIFKILCSPFGGDTLYTSGYAAYDALSPAMQKYLESLKAVHDGYPQAEGLRRAGLHVRREPLQTVHPVVRTHPVTGWKTLFVNAGFTRAILGVPKIESDAILSMLFNLIATMHDAMTRIKWDKNAVAIWDNRCIVSHSATYDFYPERRHALRVAAHAEKPYLDPESGSRQAQWEQTRNLHISKDGAIANRGYSD